MGPLIFDYIARVLLGDRYPRQLATDLHVSILSIYRWKDLDNRHVPNQENIDKLRNLAIERIARLQHVVACMESGDWENLKLTAASYPPPLSKEGAKKKERPNVAKLIIDGVI